MNNTDDGQIQRQAAAQTRQNVVSGQAYRADSGINPLVWAANPLLDMIPQIRTVHEMSDIRVLRTRIVNEINAFEARAQSVGIPREDLIGARYCLCTVLDEVVSLMPWGSNNVWANQSMLVTFHNETWGGEKYYLLLGRLVQNPERHKDLIELLYYCNALGFEGRFRLANGGFSQLEMLKKQVVTLLNKARGGYEHRLSPHWQGISSISPAWRMVPPWIVALLCVLMGIALYMVFSFRLAPFYGDTSSKLSALEVPAMNVARAAPPSAPVVKNVCNELKQNINAGGAVTVKEIGGACEITLRGTLAGVGMFASGSAEISEAYRDVLMRVGDAIPKNGVEVVVAGHTDSDPVCGGSSTSCRLRYKSNDALSEARALSVKSLLDGRIGQTGLTSAEGYGADKPVRRRDGTEDKAMSRRVEIYIMQAAQNPSAT